MLAKAMPSIMPQLTFGEALEITKVHSVTGRSGAAGASRRSGLPRAPSQRLVASLVGGGPKAQPGEISLAHGGVLFLDELPEFSRDVLEALRQPLEDREVTITRASFRATYPADFMLVAAMNPCPCGYYGGRTSRCRCTPVQVERYRNRLSGPFLDRIDLQVEMTEVGYEEITGSSTGESSAVIRQRVEAARQRQRERYQEEGILFNAQLAGEQINRYCPLTSRAQAMVKKAFETMYMSGRGYGRIRKVARTIADLAGEETIDAVHVAEAMQYRSLDKKYWGG